MTKSKSNAIFPYTHSYDLKDRIMYLDIDYLQNEEGRFKIIEIVSLASQNNINRVSRLFACWLQF
jgi:hypothetical protein